MITLPDVIKRIIDDADIYLIKKDIIIIDPRNLAKKEYGTNSPTTSQTNQMLMILDGCSRFLPQPWILRKGKKKRKGNVVNVYYLIRGFKHGAKKKESDFDILDKSIDDTMHI